MSSTFNHEREFTFTWKIHNYFSCYYAVGEKFESPRYTAENLHQTRWYLQLYPKGFNDDVKKHIALFLYRDDDKSNLSEFKRISLDIKLEILYPEGDSLHLWKTQDLFSVGCSTGLYKFVQIDQLMDKFKNWNDDTLTIRCHMSKKPKLRLRNQCEIHTKINVIRSSYKWHVNKIESSNPLENTIFSLFDSCNLEITLTSLNDKLKIKINKIDPRSLPSELLTCRISLLNTEGAEKYAKVDTHYFREKIIWEFPDFITKSVLENELNMFLKNGMFTLVFEFTCSNGMVPISVEKYAYNSSYDSSFIDTLSALEKDLGNMLNDEKFCDIKIRADDEMIPAHKVILAARSPVFSVMFNQNMIENERGIVDIPDLDKHSLKLFREFIYTGQLSSIDTKTILILIMVADRFQIISLKENCSSLLIKTMSKKNVCEILKIADTLEHSILKEYAINFILSNAHSILSSKEWAHLIKTDSKLTSEIVSQMSISYESISSKILGDADQRSEPSTQSSGPSGFAFGQAALISEPCTQTSKTSTKSAEPSTQSSEPFTQSSAINDFKFGTLAHHSETSTQISVPKSFTFGGAVQCSKPCTQSLRPSGYLFGHTDQRSGQGGFCFGAKSPCAKSSKPSTKSSEPSTQSSAANNFMFGTL